MKRALFIVGFGLLGLFFVFSVEGAVVSLIHHGGQQYESGSDERGEHQLKALFFAGPLFLAIGAWVGNSAYRSWRRGAVMIAGIVLATLVCFGVPGLPGPGANIFSYSGSSGGLVAWSAACACAAILLDRMFGGPRQQTLR